MTGDTSIEWTDAVWNPTTGCDRVSAGCDHCYAMTMAKRLKGMGSAAYQLDGDPRTSGPGFLAHEWPAALDWPLRKTKPLRIFVNSMSDLFHANISDDYIARVFAVMAQCPQHTFQILTKRHARMKALLSSSAFAELVDLACGGDGTTSLLPLPNVWLGVSVESQQWADIRIAALADTPAAVRFLSCEPLLGPVDLTAYLPQPAWSSTTPFDGVLHLLSQGGRCDHQQTAFGYRHEVAKCRQCTNGRRISWVIVGGESGPGARPMHPDWARSLRNQCAAAGVPFLFKQWGEWAPLKQLPRVDHWSPTPGLTHETTVQGKTVYRAGKHRAGRELDGRTWDEYPKQHEAAVR
jgi:protein gp37